ncbi:hypothetical protein IT084_10435 [Desulfallas sp. Bu1-1]|uniref:hypothetical protein n=1 Tax=Desulfallas sp. Bu1-1 TaxID=2787620 RepID=UPI00189CCDE9|nr:hypothetical protein [Desulfallas sp. Bu1-1]MBF7083390.1 hypothetical protein [Desulfallas sp. Bu1-1]
MTEKNQDIQLFGADTQFDLLDLAVTENPQNEQLKKKNQKKKKNNSCGASINTAGKTTTPSKPKEPEKDLERFVVLANDNEQMTFPAEMTLEEIRVELEKQYPAYTQQNTNWYFEKQEDKGRYLCIPSYKFNKMG